MSTTKDKKKLGVFERMKRIEEAKKKRTMARILTKVKELAAEVQENKVLCELYLTQIVSDEKEQKRIIDWINELEDVKPDEDRMKELRDSTKQEAKEERKEVERKIKEDPEKFMRDISGAYYVDTMTLDNTATNLDTSNTLKYTAGSGSQAIYSNATSGIEVQ